MTNNAPIGLFDSGIGGTSIWWAINHLLPNENTIYLADSKNAPYGTKSKTEIQTLSFKNTELLLEMGCKLIVVACNTATTNAIVALRNHFKVPFVGIEPAIKPAATQSKTNSIGVLATKGTLTSALFHSAVINYPETQITEQIGYGLVQLIEEGKIESQEMKDLLVTYLTPMIAANIDYLVLGCSHYPYLIPQIQKILPKHIQIIDSGEAVARQTEKIIAETTGASDLSKSHTIFYTNGNPEILKQFVDPHRVVYRSF